MPHNAWDLADRFTDAIHLADKIERLQHDIRQTGPRCGNCCHWMKSRSCPRERNVKGQSRGPSCNAPVCSQFQETSTATGRRTRLQREMASVLEK